MPFWRSSRSFFAVRTNFRFLRVFLVWALPGAVQEVVGRETLQNKGFRSNFALCGLVDLRWARCIAFMLQSIFDANFSASHKFVFSEVRILDQIGFGRQKKGLGLQNRGDFQNDVFPILPGRGPICEIFGAFSFLQLRRGLGSIRAVARNLLAAAVRMVFPKFSGVLFSTAFLRI